MAVVLEPARFWLDVRPAPDMERGDQTIRQRLCLNCTQSFGRVGMIPGRGSVALSAIQNGDPLQRFTRQLYGFDLHVIANAEFVDGNEISTALQPGPRFDGQGYFPSTSNRRQDDRAFTGAGLQAALVDFDRLDLPFIRLYRGFRSRACHRQRHKSARERNTQKANTSYAHPFHLTTPLAQFPVNPVLPPRRPPRWCLNLRRNYFHVSHDT